MKTKSILLTFLIVTVLSVPPAYAQGKARLFKGIGKILVPAEREAAAAERAAAVAAERAAAERAAAYRIGKGIGSKQKAGAGSFGPRVAGPEVKPGASVFDPPYEPLFGRTAAAIAAPGKISLNHYHLSYLFSTSVLHHANSQFIPCSYFLFSMFSMLT